MSEWQTFEKQGDTFGLEIRVRLGREITEEDYAIMSHAADALEDRLKRISVSLDPERKERAKIERQQLLSCFHDPIYVEAIPNGYCSLWCCSDRPWFIVTTPAGRIKIGWRKRVINIDWSQSNIARPGIHLFPDEDTTVGADYIHAWSYDKAKEYIKRLLAAAPKGDS